MKHSRFLQSAAIVIALSALSGVAPAFAQTEIVATPNPDADLLASEMRVLAADPRDMRALLSAGALSAKLGDPNAALAFYARAEALEPNNPRILAGRAAVLVRTERPGEALTLFQQAEAKGVAMAEYAADRALAYDLLGAPQLAQREYKVALARNPDDETRRRYALSLGITGDTQEAMALLDPLLRHSDRAAWRARAFVMAMNGDIPGAEKIAESMMPGNMGLALTPFFRRLETLSPADRAYAVHFGELKPTQARIADARLAPRLPAYVATARPTAVAAASPTPAPVAKEKDRRSRRERKRDQLASAARPTPVPARQLPQPPSSSGPLVQPLPPSATRPTQVASVQAPAPTPAPVTTPTPSPTPAPAPVRLAAAQEARPVVSRPTPVQTAAVALPEPVRTPVPAPAPAPTPVPVSTPKPSPAPVTVAAVADPTPPGPAEIGQEDSVLAAIVANITIPATELEALRANDRRLPSAEPEVAPEPVKVAAVEAPKVEAKPKPEPKAKPEPKKKPEPAKPDPAKTEPSRAWVQIAGGANENALPLTWGRLVAKSPAAFKGKGAWWVPYKATNRLLAGPFKNASDAQDFVNRVKEDGVLGFVFTSDPGQKINKLNVK